MVSDVVACMRWWTAHKEGGEFNQEDLPNEVLTFGLWKGWFKKVNGKVVVPKRL